MQPMLEAVLDHVNCYGWRMLPLIPNSKNPYIKNWGELATNNRDQLKEWWGKWPTAGIGVLLGQITRTVVIDVDGPEGAAQVEKLHLPNTLTATTAKGKHYFFRCPDRPIKKKIRLSPEIDLLGDGCYVVVDPSIHPSGKPYHFDNYGHVLAELPDSILEALDSVITKTEARPPLNIIPDGTRNVTLASLAGKMRRIGLTEEEILQVLFERNRVCVPSLTETEVRGIARSISKYPSGERVVEPLETKSAAWLMAQEMKPIRWIVEPILTEGLGMLVGAPKIGKSFLALDLALAVATGGTFLGKYPTQQGRVLFLNLEDGERRLQHRLDIALEAICEPGLLRPDKSRPALDLFEFQTRLEKSTEGGMEKLEYWLTMNPDARLVVIDTLARFRRAPRSNANAYNQDTEFMEPLQAMALSHHVCILLLHHDKKGKEDDPLNSISGTKGLPGVSDQCWLLSRGHRTEKGGNLNISGRDFENIEIALTQGDKQQWLYLGLADDVNRSRSQQAVLDELREARRPVNSSKLARELGIYPSKASRLLRKMVKEGLIYSPEYGKYCINKTGDN